jgi:hypothetical protein
MGDRLISPLGMGNAQGSVFEPSRFPAAKSNRQELSDARFRLFWSQMDQIGESARANLWQMETEADDADWVYRVGKCREQIVRQSFAQRRGPAGS